MKLTSLVNLALTRPTSSLALQVFRSLFVGGLAYIANASVLYILSLTGLHYLICSVFGFIAGVAVNYVLSVKFVFKEKAPVGRTAEVIIYIAVGLVGLGLTVVFMWFFTEIVGLFFMLSSFVAALLVFTWNFTSRKILLYSKKGMNSGRKN